MRTSKPKVLGWVCVLYALLVHAWHAIGPLISLVVLVTSPEEVSFSLSWFALKLLPFVYFLLYLLGGIGLIMLRQRAALLVLLAAVAELIHDIAIYNLSDRLDSVAGLSAIDALRSLSTFIVPAMIALFSWWLWHRREAVFVTPSGTQTRKQAEPEPAAASGKHYFRYMLLAILVFGVVIPVSSGISVKLFLDSLGEPTIPWSYFANFATLILLIPLSVWWSIPYLMLVYAARNIRTKPIWGLKTYKTRLVFIASGFVVGGNGSIGIFVNIFLEYDPLIVFVPIWLYFMPHIVAGLLVGYAIAKGVEVYSERRTGHQ
jgi:hypothetical protein